MEQIPSVTYTYSSKQTNMYIYYLELNFNLLMQPNEIFRVNPQQSSAFFFGSDQRASGYQFTRSLYLKRIFKR